MRGIGFRRICRSVSGVSLVVLLVKATGSRCWLDLRTTFQEREDHGSYTKFMALIRSENVRCQCHEVRVGTPLRHRSSKALVSDETLDSIVKTLKDIIPPVVACAMFILVRLQCLNPPRFPKKGERSMRKAP